MFTKYNDAKKVDQEKVKTLISAFSTFTLTEKCIVGSSGCHKKHFTRYMAVKCTENKHLNFSDIVPSQIGGIIFVKSIAGTKLMDISDCLWIKTAENEIQYWKQSSTDNTNRKSSYILSSFTFSATHNGDYIITLEDPSKPEITIIRKLEFSVIENRIESLNCFKNCINMIALTKINSPRSSVSGYALYYKEFLVFKQHMKEYLEYKRLKVL